MTTVREQFGSIWPYIDGCGAPCTDYSNAVMVVRGDQYLKYNTCSDYDTVGYFRRGDEIHLFARQACTLKYNDFEVNLYEGWNIFSWEPLAPIQYLVPVAIGGVALLLIWGILRR